jgi:formate hydrogenlyase subunit 3/multisubunit Na+/H+ antiporter MnhD subunit
MLAFVYTLPLLGALICLTLSRLVPTRILGYSAAILCLASGTLLIAAREQGVVGLPPLPIQLFGGGPSEITLLFDPFGWGMALIELSGGALALLGIALRLPPNLRGFGGLFALLLLLIATILVGLSLPPQALPFAWLLAALLSFAVVYASGAQPNGAGLPRALLAGMTGGLLLIGAAVWTQEDPTAAQPWFVVGGWVLATGLALGLPPFHAGLDEQASAPAAIAALLVPLGVPLLAATSLLRFFVTYAPPVEILRPGLALGGALTLLASAAGALRARRLGQLIGWQFSAQLGLVVAAMASPGVSVWLLVSTVLGTLAAYLAAAQVERSAGTDDLSQLAVSPFRPAAGLALLVAGASAVGAPGTPGFWARAWLYDGLSPVQWVLPLILAGSVLLAVSYLAPLAAFWRRPPAVPTQRPGASAPARTFTGLPVLAIVPLLGVGVVPQLSTWLVPASEVPASISLGLGTVPQLVAAITGLLLVLAVLLPAWLASRQVVANPDAPPGGVLTPDALGESLHGLAWVATPQWLFDWLWSGLVQLSQGLNRALAPFEQRYYLAGLMIGLVIVILLML